MTAPSFVDALDAYAHAIACGAPSIVQADRFADLTAAHRARMNQLHETEEAVTRVWDRLLPCLDAPDEWVSINGMPGTCCSECGMPTESEPCAVHQATAYARCNA
jgi:hypothetical protein